MPDFWESKKDALPPPPSTTRWVILFSAKLCATEPHKTTTLHAKAATRIHSWTVVWGYTQQWLPYFSLIVPLPPPLDSSLWVAGTAAFPPSPASWVLYTSVAHTLRPPSGALLFTPLQHLQLPLPSPLVLSFGILLLCIWGHPLALFIYFFFW